MLRRTFLGGLVASWFSTWALARQVRSRVRFIPFDDDARFNHTFVRITRGPRAGGYSWHAIFPIWADESRCCGWTKGGPNSPSGIAREVNDRGDIREGCIFYADLRAPLGRSDPIVVDAGSPPPSWVVRRG